MKTLPNELFNNKMQNYKKNNILKCKILWITTWMHVRFKVWWLHSLRVTTSMRNDTSQMLAITFKILWPRLGLHCSKIKSKQFWQMKFPNTQLTLGIAPPSLIEKALFCQVCEGECQTKFTLNPAPQKKEPNHHTLHYISTKL